MGSYCIYRGLDHRGIARMGVLVRDDISPATFAALKYQQRWRKLSIERDGEQVGGICPGDNGKRTWWADNA